MGVQKQVVELFSETLRLSLTDEGEGRAFLILHGGVGPASVSGLGGALAKNARVIVPTHPGFDGEPRPDRFTRIDDLVLVYLALLEKLNLKNVVVVGNSMGGWIAAELALRQSPRIAGLVLLNAVGIDTGLAERSIVDPVKLTPAERAALVFFHAPDRFSVAPSGPDAATTVANNQRTVRVYSGELFMYEPTLRPRLARMSVPTLIAWGESDGFVDVDYGRLYASSIPGARFELIPEAAHFPQIERPDEVVRLIGDFTAGL
jgi:pimeloyl-ACP methyl ester carboxylesterase